MYGCRLVAGLGCILAAIGFISSMFATELWVLYITFGVIGGLGFGLMYLPSIIIVSFYFKKRRAFATGLAVCGSGIGTFLFAPLSAFLEDHFSWRQSLLIVAGISLNGLVAAAVYRPPKPTPEQFERATQIVAKSTTIQNVTTSRLESINEMQEVSSSPVLTNGAAPDAILDLAGSSPVTFVLELFSRQDSRNWRANSTVKRQPEANNAMNVMRRDSVSVLNRPLSRMDIFHAGSALGLAEAAVPVLRRQGKRNASAALLATAATDLATAEAAGWRVRMWLTLGTMIDVRLLKSPTFMLLAVSNFLTLAGFFGPFVYLPRYAESVGHSRERATFLISVLGIANIVFRVLSGWISDQGWANVLQLHNAALVLGGAATMAVPFARPYWLLVLYCLVFGLATACFASLRSIICAELLGLERLTSSFGLLLLIMGFAALAGSPIAGALFDATGKYDASFYALGGSVALSGLLAIPLHRVSMWEFGGDKCETQLQMEVITVQNDGDMPAKKNC